MRLLCVLLFCVASANISNGSKILGIFPMPCKSHYILGEALMRGLVHRGHDVTMISPYSLDTPMKNYKDVVINGMVELKDNFGPQFTRLNNTWIQKLQMMYTIFPEMYNTGHNASNVREFVQKGDKYDLCIVSFMISESMFGICNAVQAPAVGFSIVGLSSFLTYHTNNPVPYSYVPSPFLSYTDEMSFFERLQNLAAWYLFDAVMHFVSLPYQEKLMKRYYPNAPPMNTIMEDVDIFLMNTHTSTDSPKPILPNVIPIGGFHLQIMDKIPKDIKKFLDDSKRGVIYFNMGSNVKSSELEPFVLDAILKGLSKADFDVLWKYESDLPNKPNNVRIAKWLPQRPILMHPNVKMFITHGGLGGTVEAIYGGIPMICLPMFGDQPKNCADSELKGYGITMDLKSITEDKLLDAIKEMSTNPTYKDTISLKSDLYRNQEMNPMDKAIFWAEHVIRHKGAKHLKSRATTIPWYQYYLLDVISLISIILLVIFSLVYLGIKLSLKILSCLWCQMTGKDNKINKKQKVKKQ